MSREQQEQDTIEITDNSRLEPINRAPFKPR